MGEDSTRWTEQEMFDTNSKLLGGRICEYDGNPHDFVEKGFGDGEDRLDPHSFHIVGGSFMNNTKAKDVDTAAIIAATATANYQTLVHGSDLDGDGALQPFFNQHGATPWGDVCCVEEAAGGAKSTDNNTNNEDDNNEFANESSLNSNDNTITNISSSSSSSTGPTPYIYIY